MKNNALANKLKELRISHSYKQVDIAAFLGVVRQTYANYENGLRTPDTETLHKIAALYGITLDDLMQLTTTLDPELYYNAPHPSQNSVDIAGFLDYFNKPDNLKRFKTFSNLEKELFYYFDRLPSDDDKKEIIEIIKVKLRRASK